MAGAATWQGTPCWPDTALGEERENVQSAAPPTHLRDAAAEEGLDALPDGEGQDRALGADKLEGMLRRHGAR